MISKEMIEPAYKNWFKEANEFNELGFVSNVQYPSSLDVFKAGVNWTITQFKATIPTDVEIEEKAKIDVDETWKIYEGRPNYKSMLKTFKNGYKQALKDLGYDK